jgi:hypothetical protein
MVQIILWHAFKKSISKNELKTFNNKRNKKILVSQIKKFFLVWWDLYQDPKNKLSLYKLTFKLYMQKCSCYGSFYWQAEIYYKSIIWVC